MRYFYDTEFIEDGRTIDLISIGMVCEDGREYYAISSEFDASKANQWVKDNVLSHLPPKMPAMTPPTVQPLAGPALAWKSRRLIKSDLLEFCNPQQYGKPEFWAYYADYDHVALCQLFGTMMDLPEGWPMYTRDVKQFCDWLGNPTLTQPVENDHHALFDARWTLTAYDYLETLAGVLPLPVAGDEEGLGSLIICDSIAGGANATDDMPNVLSLRQFHFDEYGKIHVTQDKKL